MTDQPDCGHRCTKERLYDCGHCYYATQSTLGRLPNRYGTCIQHLAPAQSAGDRVSGTKERPLVIRVDVHDLMADIHDQLADWVRYVADECRLQGPVIPQQRTPQTNPAAVRVLTNVRWLNGQHDWLSKSAASLDYGDEIRTLEHRVKVLCQLYSARPELKAGVPCRNPNCEGLSLFVAPGSDRVECPYCPQRMTFGEYADWVDRCAKFVKSGQAAYADWVARMAEFEKGQTA